MKNVNMEDISLNGVMTAKRNELKNQKLSSMRKQDSIPKKFLRLMKGGHSLMAKRKPKIELTYQASSRTLLEKGDRFRATQGPYYESTQNGKTVHIKMKEPGPFKFIEALRVGKHRLWIRALNKDNATCLLWLGPRERSKELPNLVNRPYKIHKLRK